VYMDDYSLEGWQGSKECITKDKLVSQTCGDTTSGKAYQKCASKRVLELD